MRDTPGRRGFARKPRKGRWPKGYWRRIAELRVEFDVESMRPTLEVPKLE